MIYHSILQREWDTIKSSLEYKPDSLLTDGFVHFSLLEQVIGVTYFIFGNSKETVLLLEVDEKKLKPRVVHEDLKGHGRYPHVYGPINLDSVVNVYKLDRTPGSGTFGFLLPDSLRMNSVDLKDVDNLNVL